MHDSKIARMAPLTGIAALGLLILSTLLINYYNYLPDPADIQGHLTENWKMVAAGGYVGALAAAALLWFSGSVRTALRVAEGGTGRVSAIAFGGGVGAAVSLLVIYSLVLASAMRAGADSGISEVAAVTLYDAYGMLFTGGMGVSLAIMIAAFAVVTARTGLMGQWFVWLSWLAAVGLVTPLSYLFLALAMLWIVYVGIWMYRRG